MLSNELELTLRRALSIATKNKHEYATYEHLLLALLDDKDTQKLLVKNEVPIELLKTRLENYIKHELEDLIDKDVKESKPTAGFQRVVQRAALHTQAGGHKIITGMHVLAEFFFEHDAYALTCLREVNLERTDVIKYIKKANLKANINLIKKLTAGTKDVVKNESANDIQLLPQDVKEEKDKFTDKKGEISKFCTNLNLKAKSNNLDCLIGRKDEIQRTIEILCRRKKNNAILVGEPGVGKTAIAEGLALRIVNNDVPEALKNSIIYSLDIGSLVAGTKFRGDFEERIKNLLDYLREDTNAILFIDEIHTIIGAGSTATGSIDAGNLLKPALAKGELRCIGSTTFKEFHNYFERDMALARRFQKIIVSEPDEATTLEILLGLKNYYEKHHNVSYDISALKAAITLSTRYISGRHLPDKAIDLIDEAGSRNNIYYGKTSSKRIITNKNIEILISNIINIPTDSFEVSEANKLKKLSSNLKNLVFGQDHAIDSLCGSIKLSRAGLKKASKPIGCYMFAGPTGVGKTELAKQLALLSNMKLIKFDMSEFSETSSVAKLIGSAPGYVGYDQGGLLTDEVDKHPHSVILFDEIEKANTDIFNLLLQVMDEGKLTTSTGKVINFSNSIIIFTTNLVAMPEKPLIGFSHADEFIQKTKMNMDAIDEKFSPEFQSRLDKIILFNPISDIIDKIVTKSLKDLSINLAGKKVKLFFNSAVKRFLIESYMNNEAGVRGLEKTIDNDIRQAIAEELLFGKLKNGGSVAIKVKKNNKLAFKFSDLIYANKKELETSESF